MDNLKGETHNFNPIDVKRSAIKNAVESYGVNDSTMVAMLLSTKIVRIYNERKTKNGERKFNKHFEELFGNFEPKVAEELKKDLIGVLKSIEESDNDIVNRSLPGNLAEINYKENFKLLINFCDIFLNPKNLTNLDGDLVSDAFLTAQMYKIGGSVSRLGFLKTSQIVGLNLLALSSAGNFILNSYQDSVESGSIESEEGMMMANIREQKQIPMDELILYKDEKQALVDLISEWAATDEDFKPFPISFPDRDRIKKWLTNGALEAVANTARVLMLANPYINKKYYGKLMPYLVEEYLPEIFKLSKELAIPPITYLQFLEYNGAGTDAVRINMDSMDLQKQAIFGALDSLIAYRLKFEFPIDLAHVLAYKMPDGYRINPNMGAYEGIRALYPTGTPIGLEYGALAQGICVLETNSNKVFHTLKKTSAKLVESSFELVEAKNNFDLKRNKLVEQIDEYTLNISESELKLLWADILTNPENKFWANIGLGAKSKNLAAVFFQLTNFTKAWEGLMITDPNDLSIENLSNALILGQGELMYIADAFGQREGLRALLFDQLKNPYFRNQISKLLKDNSNFTGLQNVLNKYWELESDVVPFRQTLSKSMYQFTKNQFLPEVQNIVSIGTAAWLDSLSNNKSKYPTIYEFRDDPYCRAFALLSCREISGVDGGLAPKEGIRFRDVDMPLLALNDGEYTLKLLDRVMGIIKEKLSFAFKDTDLPIPRLTLDAMCREMDGQISPELMNCFISQAEYTDWNNKVLKPMILKLMGWFKWSGVHLALSRYMAINGERV